MLLGFYIFFIPPAGGIASVIGLAARAFYYKAEGYEDGLGQLLALLLGL